MKKEIALPVVDPFHLVDVCAKAILGAYAMGINVEFNVSVQGDDMKFTIVADVTEEEAAELDKFQSFANEAARQMVAEAAGSSAAVN